jgi:hypothetical protein
MLAEFWEFDRKMIHDKYKAVVQSFEGDWNFLLLFIAYGQAAPARGVYRSFKMAPWIAGR